MKGFLGSTALEVAIEASFVYFLLAIFCSTVNEWIATLLNARANTLRETIHELLDNQNLREGREFVELFYGHPIITGMMRGRRHPAYLPSHSFTTAVLDLATGGLKGSLSFEVLENCLAELPNGDVKTSLLALIQTAAGDLHRAEENIRNWFNDAMSRASASYKSRIHTWTIVMAALLTVATNADTVQILHSHSGLMSGWSKVAFHCGLPEWLSRLSGWCLTTAAVSLGAPFWFDVLKKCSGLRRDDNRPS